MRLDDRWKRCCLVNIQTSDTGAPNGLTIIGRNLGSALIVQVIKNVSTKFLLGDLQDSFNVAIQ